ncbi:MAG TPA: hypothetical protein VGR96_13415 [Acidobacteriaceae bacterium]|nr:hypothetical protein [Acidobacteriaceae bacterium]
MRKRPRFRLLSLTLGVLSAGGVAGGQQTRVPAESPLPAAKAAAGTEPFPGVVATPIGKTPLTGRPYVYTLKHLTPAEMSAPDASLAAASRPELAAKAAQLNFDLSDPGWEYRQIACPAFPDYLFLAYSHGPEPNGTSKFVAALARNRSQVWIMPAVSHGLRPFDIVWSKAAAYEIFNGLLRQERGLAPLGNAPNWLVIGMCYAEFTGNHVQVLTSQPEAGPTLDLLRLDASLPQLNIQPDRSATVTFSDASRPAATIGWTLAFDPKGQITSVEQLKERQPAKIALKP